MASRTSGATTPSRSEGSGRAMRLLSRPAIEMGPSEHNPVSHGPRFFPAQAPVHTRACRKLDGIGVVRLLPRDTVPLGAFVTAYDRKREEVMPLPVEQVASVVAGRELLRITTLRKSSTRSPTT